MMDTFVGPQHRIVFWLATPTLGTHAMNSAAIEIDKVVKAEAEKRSRTSCTSTRTSSSPIPTATTRASSSTSTARPSRRASPTACTSRATARRISPRELFTLLDARWHLREPARQGRSRSRTRSPTAAASWFPATTPRRARATATRTATATASGNGTTTHTYNSNQGATPDDVGRRRHRRRRSAERRRRPRQPRHPRHHHTSRPRISTTSTLGDRVAATHVGAWVSSPPMSSPLQAASAAVELAAGAVDAAVRNLAELASRRRQGLGRQARRAPGARVRPRPRGGGGRGVPRDVRVRRTRRDGIDARARVRRRRDRRHRRPHGRARRDLGRRSRRARARASVRRPRTAIPRSLPQLADQCVKHGSGPTHLSDDFELVADTFRRFAEDKIRPVAEHVHRTQRRRPRGRDPRPRRDRRLRAVGAGGVRRATRPAARATTSGWSSRPKSCRAGRSASAGRS